MVPGIAMLKADSVVGNRVDEAIATGVKVVACENTMKNQKLTQVDMLNKISYVQAGVVEIMQRSSRAGRTSVRSRGWRRSRSGRAERCRAVCLGRGRIVADLRHRGIGRFAGALHDVDGPRGFAIAMIRSSPEGPDGMRTVTAKTAVGDGHGGETTRGAGDGSFVAVHGCNLLILVRLPSFGCAGG
jgi:hypothetical protein